MQWPGSKFYVPGKSHFRVCVHDTNIGYERQSWKIHPPYTCGTGSKQVANCIRTAPNWKSTEISRNTGETVKQHQLQRSQFIACTDRGLVRGQHGVWQLPPISPICMTIHTGLSSWQNIDECLNAHSQARVHTACSIVLDPGNKIIDTQTCLSVCAFCREDS